MARRRSTELNEFFATSLEERKDKLLAMLDAVLDPQENVEVTVDCPRCRAGAGGKSMKKFKVALPVPKYDVREAMAILKLMAEYGVSRPPEEKKIEVDVNQTIRDITLMSDEELARLAGDE